MCRLLFRCLALKRIAAACVVDNGKANLKSIADLFEETGKLSLFYSQYRVQYMCRNLSSGGKNNEISVYSSNSGRWEILPRRIQILCAERCVPARSGLITRGQYQRR